MGVWTEKAWSRPVGAGDSLCDGSEGRIGFAIEPIRRLVPDYLDLRRVRPFHSAGRDGGVRQKRTLRERRSLVSRVRHGSQSAPGCGRKLAMGPALAFVQENAAQENTRERAWRSCPKGLLPDFRRTAGEVQTVQNDVPASTPVSCGITERSLVLLDKVQSNEGLPGAKFTARSSPRSRFEPAVRTPGGPVARHPQLWGRKPALRREIPSNSAKDSKGSHKLLICGPISKGREFWHRTGSPRRKPVPAPRRAARRALQSRRGNGSVGRPCRPRSARRDRRRCRSSKRCRPGRSKVPPELPASS